MKFGDVTTNIFMRSKAQQLQLCFIGAQDRAISTHQVKRDAAVLEEIREIQVILCGSRAATVEEMHD